MLCFIKQFNVELKTSTMNQRRNQRVINMETTQNLTGIEDADLGLTTAELVKIYGVDKGTIHNWRKELGVEQVKNSSGKLVIPQSQLDKFHALAESKQAAKKQKRTEVDDVLESGSLAIAELQEDLIQSSETETDSEIEEIRREAEIDETIRSIHYWNTRYQVRTGINSAVKTREAERRDRQMRQLQAVSSGRLALGK
jgi:hypothetical protein